MNNQAPINLFVFSALECEAKTLINQFQLKKDSARHPFSIYKNDNMSLTVTGIGKVSMAAGVAYTMAISAKPLLPIMVNIGIAGHKSKPVGTLLLASKLVDAESGKSFYPQLMGAGWPETSQLKTTALPNTQYSDECLNDMEASAFYEVAVRFSSSELIHCLKLVSDNQHSSVDHIKAKVVVEWFSRHQSVFPALFQRLEALRASVLPVELEECQEIVNQWHFTVTGEIKLKALLRQWRVLSGYSWLEECDGDFSSGKEVLQVLEADIGRLFIKF